MNIFGKIIAYTIAVGFILLLAFYAACVLVLQDGKKVCDLDYEFTETDKIIERGTNAVIDHTQSTDSVSAYSTNHPTPSTNDE